MAYSLGAVKGQRGAASGSGVVRIGGGVNFSGGTPYIDFGRQRAFEMSTAYTMFVQAKPVNTTSTMAMMGNSGVSSTNGIDIGFNGSAKILARCSGASSVRFISAEAYDTTVQTFMGVVRPGPSGAWLGVYRNGVLLTNGTGDAVPATPTFSNGWYLSGSIANPFLGTIYSAAMWGRPRPQRLAELLDVDPARLWWWPGKNRDRTFSIPSGGTLFTATLSASAGNSASKILQAQVIRSANSSNSSSKITQAQAVKSGNSGNNSSKVMQAQVKKSASSAAVASIIKLVNKTLAAASIGVTALIAILKVKTLALTATCGNSVTILRSTLKSLSSSGGNLASNIKVARKSLAASCSNTVGNIKTVSKTTLASCTNVVSAAAVKMTAVAGGLIIAIGKGFADVMNRLGFRGDTNAGRGDSSNRNGNRNDRDGGGGDSNIRGGGRG